MRDGKLSCAEWVIPQLLKQKFSYLEHFPLTISFVEALLVIPVSNAWPERGGIESEVDQESAAKSSEGRHAKFPDAYQLNKWPTCYFTR